MRGCAALGGEVVKYTETLKEPARHRHKRFASEVGGGVHELESPPEGLVGHVRIQSGLVPILQTPKVQDPAPNQVDRQRLGGSSPADSGRGS